MSQEDQTLSVMLVVDAAVTTTTTTTIIIIYHRYPLRGESIHTWCGNKVSGLVLQHSHQVVVKRTTAI
jgi:hypothetical protein